MKRLATTAESRLRHAGQVAAEGEAELRGERAPLEIQRIGRHADALAFHQQFDRGPQQLLLRRAHDVLEAVAERAIDMRDHRQGAAGEQRLRQARDERHRRERDLRAGQR